MDGAGRWQPAEASPVSAPPRRTRAGPTRPTAATIGLGAAAALAGAALYNHWQSRRAERDNPPVGRFLDLDGLRLHYLDEGPAQTGRADPPVVLLHGNAVTLDDWVVSGVFDLAVRSRRVVAFDRPGFGYSARPRGRSWTPAAQAHLLRRACRRLGIRRPVLVGHSWGTLVALAWALQARHEVAGLVLLAGYYFPGARLDAVLVAPAATPVLGDLLTHTISPPLTQMTLPSTLRAMFAPRRVPVRFQHLFPQALIPRPKQIGAMAEEGAIMVPAAAALRRHYGDVRCPSIVMTGDGDRIVAPEDQSVRLAQELDDAELRLVPRAGHMLHHAVPGEVADAIIRVAAPPVRPQDAA